MAKNEDVARNWINEKVNRLHKRVQWKGSNMFCVPDTIFSYGHHYPIAHNTRLLKNERSVFFFNTERIGGWSGTRNHKLYVREEIRRIKGICIRVHNENLDDIGLQRFDCIDSMNIVDINGKGEALIRAEDGFALITQGAMIHIKGSYDSVEEARKSLKPKGLGKDFVKWRNYYFKPTGMNDKEFAASQKLTIAALNKWTRQNTVYTPYDHCYEIKARIFGSNPFLDAFELKNENPAPFVSGTIYDSCEYAYHKTIFSTQGEWWKVLPMNCDAYRLK